ncbi:MAG: hypothetical protein LH632_04245 [Rhodoferax sp.]|nr:hypothetical protein [Rhodoferax sp.]
MNPIVSRRRAAQTIAAAALGIWSGARAAQDMPLFDAHIHYSHDAWELVPPKQAVRILRDAGLRGALVSCPTTRAHKCCWPKHRI